MLGQQLCLRFKEMQLFIDEKELSVTEVKITLGRLLATWAEGCINGNISHSIINHLKDLGENLDTEEAKLLFSQREMSKLKKKRERKLAPAGEFILVK